MTAIANIGQDTFIEDALLGLRWSSKGKNDGKVPKYHKLPISVFRRAMVFKPEYYGENFSIFTDVKLSDLGSDLDITLSSPAWDSGDILQAHRVQRISMAMARGLIVPVATPILRISSLFMSKKYEVVTFRRHFTQRLDGSVESIDITRYKQGQVIGKDDDVLSYSGFNPHSPRAEAVDHQTEMMLRCSIGHQFSSEFEWHIEIGIENGVSLLFPISPSSAKDAFRMREIPDGKNRRPSILNWVKQHYRRKKTSDDSLDFSLVRKHFRGSESFEWDGFSCQIHPSASDIRVYQRVHGKFPKKLEHRKGLTL